MSVIKVGSGMAALLARRPIGGPTATGPVGAMAARRTLESGDRWHVGPKPIEFLPYGLAFP